MIMMKQGFKPTKNEFNVTTWRHVSPLSKPLPIIDKRGELGDVLQREGMRFGLEVGVQSGHFANKILSKWTSCEKYILIDPWKHQANYKDHANAPQATQDALMNRTQTLLQKFSDRGTQLQYIRDYSTNAHKQIADDSLDWVYIDARHDFQAMTEDLNLFWPKLKVGGIYSGHDFCDADEEPSPNQNWCTFADGSNCTNNKAVKGAVEEFAAKYNKQIVVPRRETIWVSWYLRK